MTNNIKLQEVCKQLHIPVVGTTSWPLPIEAREILQESNPCPFTAADIDERLIGTTDFMPHSAIVCLCHMKVLRIYPVTRGPLITI